MKRECSRVADADKMEVICIVESRRSIRIFHRSEIRESDIKIKISEVCLIEERSQSVEKYIFSAKLDFETFEQLFPAAFDLDRQRESGEITRKFCRACPRDMFNDRKYGTLKLRSRSTKEGLNGEKRPKVFSRDR